MTFKQRLKFYGFGFLLGIMLVYGMFGTRSCTTPNEIRMEQLVFQQFKLSDVAKCKLKCLHKNEALLKIELRHFEINYDISAIHKKPCGEYYIQPKKDYAAQYNYNLVIYDCDTISTINDIKVIGSNSCTCQ
jgi:hypothetical protein